MACRLRSFPISYAHKFEFLYDVHAIPPLLVILPNGALCNTIGEKLDLVHSWSLRKFYSFRDSLAVLFLFLNFKVQFMYWVVYIFYVWFIDDSLKILIEVGEQWDGLYYLRNVTSIRINKVAGLDPEICDIKGWGTFQILLLNFYLMYPLLKIRNLMLSVFVQQKQAYFLNFLNKSSKIFTLIHCDVCGSYRVKAHGHAKFFLTYCW